MFSLARILSSPKARTILLNGAVRKGERLVPPSALEVLMRVTFPAPSARLKVLLLEWWKDYFLFCLICVKLPSPSVADIHFFVMFIVLRLLKGLKQFIQLWKRLLLLVLLGAKHWNKLPCRYQILQSELLGKVSVGYWSTTLGNFYQWGFVGGKYRKINSYIYKQDILTRYNPMQSSLTYAMKLVVFSFGAWLKTVNATSSG